MATGVADGGSRSLIKDVSRDLLQQLLSRTPHARFIMPSHFFSRDSVVRPHLVGLQTAIFDHSPDSRLVEAQTLRGLGSREHLLLKGDLDTLTPFCSLLGALHELSYPRRHSVRHRKMMRSNLVRVELQISYDPILALNCNSMKK